MTPEEELELCRVCLSDAEGMYSLKCNDLRELQAKVKRAVEILGALHLMKSHDAGPVYDAARVDEALEALR